jgi:flavodoxin
MEETIMKKLVAYFSASGTTKNAAIRLAKAVGADLFEIRPAVPYTSADLDWTNQKSRSSIEMNDPGSRPEIAERVANMDAYDTVFIGFPIWWYVAPTIINTFVESYDFSGKALIPFATSGGSGLGKTADVLKPLCSETAKWLPGKMLNRTSDRELAAWLEQLEK